MGERLSIGAMARDSGLSVSALRFYDRAGVLRPAAVDPITGYRSYDGGQVRAARLIAALRRVRMPLADIGAVLAALPEPAAAVPLLERHLRRLETGLADARHQLDLARDLVESLEKPVTDLTVRTVDLAAALVSVRFAVGTDPELPALCGVLVHFDGEALRLVATDRFRLAVAALPVTGSTGPPARAVVAPELFAALDPDRAAETTVSLGPDAVTIAGRSAAPVDAVFPDYERLLPAAPDTARQVGVTPGLLREQLAAGPVRTMPQQPGGPEHEISVLRVVGDAIEIAGGDGAGAGEEPDLIGVNREFLLQALDAGGSGQLVLGLDGPIDPLVLSYPERPGSVSLVMPVRLQPVTDRGQPSTAPR